MDAKVRVRECRVHDVLFIGPSAPGLHFRVIHEQLRDRQNILEVEEFKERICVHLLTH